MKIIKKSFYFLATVFVAVAFFAHIFLPATEEVVSEARAEIRNYENQLQENNLNLLSVSKDLHLGEIDIDKFNEEYSLLNISINKLNDKIVLLKKDYAILKKEVKIFGYPSRHKFIWNFGIGLVILVLGLELLVTAKLFDNARKQAKSFGGFTSVMIAGYYMAWVFFPENDLPLKVYFMVVVLIGFISAVAAYWIVNTKAIKVQHLKHIIRYLNSRIISDIPPMIKDIHVNDYEELIWETLDYETK